MRGINLLILFILSSQSLLFASEDSKKPKKTYPRFTSFLYNTTGLNGITSKELSHSLYIYNVLSINENNTLQIIPKFNVTTNFTGSNRFAFKFYDVAFAWSFKRYNNEENKFRSKLSFASVYNASKKWIESYYLLYAFNKDLQDDLILQGANYFKVDYLNFDQSRVGHTLTLWYILNKKISDKWGIYTDIIYNVKSPNHKTVIAKNRKIFDYVMNSVSVYRTFTDKLSIDFNVGQTWYENGSINKGGNFFENLSYTLLVTYDPLFSWPKLNK